MRRVATILLASREMIQKMGKRYSPSPTGLLVLLLFVTTVSSAQTQPTTPAEEESKIKYADKIGHWLVAYGMAGPDFMQEQRTAFKASAFAEVYVEGIIDYDKWMFNLLNRVTVLRYPVEERQNPHLTFQVKFKPTSDELTNYTVQLALQSSIELNTNLAKIANTAADHHLKDKKYADPAVALPDVEKALAEAMNALADKLGNNLAPNLMVRYQNEIFWNGHTIDILDSEGNSVELEALNKEGKLMSPSDMTWTNADPFESKGVVDLTGISSKLVTLKKNGDKDSDALKVTLKRVNLSEDINDLLRKLIVEVLTTKRTQAIDTIGKLRQDSIKNATDLGVLIALLESNNFPMESGGATPTPMFANPILADSATTLNDNNKVNSFKALRNRKKIRSTIQRKVNVVAFADLIVDNPERIKILLDELLKNSGRLIARLLLNIDSKGKADQARDIVTEFLNQNLERIAGGYYPDVLTQEPVLAVAPVAPASPTFEPDKFLYINSRAAFAGKDSLVIALNAYLQNQNPPLYVFINYSQDVSTEAYLARAKNTRPVGLPQGARYKVYTLVNIPGSVMEQAFKIYSDEVSGLGTYDNFKEMIFGEVTNAEDGIVRFGSKWMTDFLVSLRKAYRENTNFIIGRPPISQGCNDFPVANAILGENKSVYPNVQIIQEAECGKILTFTIGEIKILENEKILVKDTKGEIKITIELVGSTPERKVLINSLYTYLFTKPENILLFVNGYRKVSAMKDATYFLTEELPRSGDNISVEYDPLNYWEGIDEQFVRRIGGENLRSLIVYADGHDYITTSNHVNDNIPSSKGYFIESMLSSLNAKVPFSSVEPPVSNPCYHDPSCVKLHTIPNITGFNTRVENGRAAGQKLVNQVKNGNLPFGKNSEGKQTGVVDIVAHSMGYAYALGMIEKIKEAGYRLGRFYIIAPENACSGAINLSDFEEVWQYGSNEAEDPAWQQDGIAPQCGVKGLPSAPATGSSLGRIYIPQGNPNRDFIGAHSIGNYRWIFTNQTLGLSGYVKERK